MCLSFAVYAQQTSIAATANINITKDYGYGDGLGASLNWYVSIPELKIIPKDKLVYIGEVEYFNQPKKYLESGHGILLTNKGRYFLTDKIFVEAGIRNGWYSTDTYKKGSTYLKFGGGFRMAKQHYIYYNYGKDIHKYSDDGITLLSNKGTSQSLNYDAFLPITNHFYGLMRVNYTRGCNQQPAGYPNSNLGRFCGNFYNFGFGIGLK